MKNRVNRVRGTAIAVTAAAILGGAALAGCTTAVPGIGECAATTNGGFGSSGQGVTSVVHPGDQFQVGNGNTAWYWPCNDRNFVTSATIPGADRKAPEYAVRTKAAGSTPGMPVYVWTSVYFTPTQNNNAMKRFLAFCFKYTCATQSPQSPTDTLAHSSSPGWENMLVENMGPAVDRAAQVAVQNYGPDLWTDQGAWDQLGNDIAADMNAQLDKETETTIPFFCGSGSTQGANGTCTQMTVIVSNVTPADPAVVTNYNKEVAAEQAAAPNAARLRAAQQLYGNEANYWLGVQDSEADCTSKCTIYIGNPGTVPAAGK
jgi:hypothetical protein